MAWFRAGGGNGIPNQLKDNMDAVLNKKFGTSTTYPPGEWPDDVNLLGVLEEKTTTKSAIAHINDGADRVPVRSWQVTLGASLDGYSEIDVIHAGKNLFNVADYSQIYTDRDGVDSYNYRYMIIQLKPNTTYTVSQNSGEYSGTPIILINNALPVGGANYFDMRKASDTKTYTTDSTGRLYIGSVNSYDDVAYARLQVCNVQIEAGSTATTYEPYTAPTTHTAQLGRTVYGGTADIVNGAGTETHQEIDLGSLTWVYASASNRFYANLNLVGIYTNFPTNANEIADITCADYETITFSSLSGDTSLNNKVAGVITDAPFITIRDTRFSNANDFKNAVTGKKAVIPLATPTDFTFTPITAETALGVNNFWADEGDSQVTYRSSGTETIIAPDLTTKSITENGTYNASSDNAYGYSQVTVNVTPPAVQTVQYDNLSFNGDLYIELPDNLVSPNHSYFIDFTTETQADATGEHAIFGIKNDYYVNFVGIRYDNLRYQVGQNGGSTNISNSWDELTGRHTFLYDGAGTVYFDTDAHTYSYNPSNTIGDNIPIVIGSATATPRMGKTWKGLIHRFTIRNTSTNTLVADYVPAAKQSGQTIVATGLLDLVSNNFVTTPACSVSNDE